MYHKKFKCDNCSLMKDHLVWRAKYYFLGKCCDDCFKKYRKRMKEIFYPYIK